MSLSLAKEIGLSNFWPSQVYIEYTDLSFSTPYGVLENVVLQVGNGLPTNFQVVVMKDSKSLHVV